MAKDQELHIYTDGACSGNPGPGGWGAILSYPNGHVKELGGANPQTTNNQMEMLAVVEALKEAASSYQAVVRVHSDSKYVVDGITGWIFGWMRKGWVNSQKKPVKNKELWQAMYSETKKFEKIHWDYVPGHSGVPGNERCDEIAVAFTEGSAVDLYDGPEAGYGVDIRS